MRDFIASGRVCSDVLVNICAGLFAIRPVASPTPCVGRRKGEAFNSRCRRIMPRHDPANVNREPGRPGPCRERLRVARKRRPVHSRCRRSHGHRLYSMPGLLPGPSASSRCEPESAPGHILQATVFSTPKEIRKNSSGIHCGRERTPALLSPSSRRRLSSGFQQRSPASWNDPGGGGDSASPNQGGL